MTKKKERDPKDMSTWDEYRQVEKAAKGIDEIIRESEGLCFDIESPRAVLGELRDEIYGQTGGEAKWGAALDPLYKWVDYVQDRLAGEGPLEQLSNSVVGGLEELDRSFDIVLDEHAEQVSDQAKAETLEPIEHSGRSEAEMSTTLDDLHKVTAHAVDLVKYLDGDASLADVDTDDLRYRLRRLGFSVNLTGSAS